MRKNEKFEMIYEKYRRLVYMDCFRRVNNESVAEEMAQQVFASYYMHMEHVKDDLIKAWLLKASKNAVIDFYKKASTRHEVTEDISVIAADNSLRLAHSPIEATAKKQERIELTCRILEDVKAVNKNWYEAIRLVCLEEYSHKEAAEMLGISVDMLKARLYRGRMYIRDKYGKEYF